jgi:PASTA domain
MSVQTEDTGRETAYERGLRHGGGSAGNSGGGSFAWLKRPLGPLPLWVWLALLLFGAIGYYLWQKHNAASSTSAASTDTSTGTTDSDLIPQFVNQVYTNGAPPETVPPKGTTPPTTTSVKVPNITGDSVVDASSALQSLGLIMTPEPAAVKGKTHVITSQTPAAGATAAKGSKVTIKYKTT